MTRIHDLAVSLLASIWIGMPQEYKKKYSFSIWTQFENQVRSAAYTTTLSHFLSRICSRLGVELREQNLETVRDVICCGEDRALLRALRDESALLVTMVRLANEERKQKGRVP